MVLAIETDGATYHSSATARDRDRLRQEHLENLGWRFQRIWSQAWFTSRQHEVERVVDAYHRAVAAADQPPLEKRPPEPAKRPHPSSPSTHSPERPFPRVPPAGSPITEYSHQQLRAVVRWVESDTLMRTKEQLLSEVMRHLGFQKRGKRIVAAINAAIDAERTN